MKPIPDEVLRTEHDSIRGLLDALEYFAEGIRREDAFSKDDLYDALSVLSDFVDRSHAGKEEAILFPAMAPTSRENAELVKQLTEDHVLFRDYIASIRGLLPKARTRAIRRRIAGRLRTYARLHKEHMRVVDDELLPQVHRLLPEGERARIVKAFAQVEEREIGWGMKDAYVAIIRRLVETYTA